MSMEWGNQWCLCRNLGPARSGIGTAFAILAAVLLCAACGSSSAQGSLNQATQALFTAKNFTMIATGSSNQRNGRTSTVIVIDHNGSASAESASDPQIAYATPNGTVNPATISILADGKQYVGSVGSTKWVVDPEPSWFSPVKYLTLLDVLDSGSAQVQGSSFSVDPNLQVLWDALGQHQSSPIPFKSAQLTGTISNGRIATIHVRTQGDWQLNETQTFEKVDTSPQVHTPTT